jgi:peptide/nickel transport system permease protein
VKVVGYWSIVAAQLRKRKLAMFGLRCVLGLFFVAVYAPVIACDKPFYYGGSRGVRFPWPKHLFNRLTFPQPVDLFFNLLALYLPIAWLAFLALRGGLRRAERWGRRPFRLCVAALGAVFLWLYLGIYLPDSVVRAPVARVLLAPGIAIREACAAPDDRLDPYATDYHAFAEEERKAGRDPTAVFPPVPYRHDNVRRAENRLPPDWFLGPVRTDLGAVGKHPLGTDPGGKDVFTTLLYGTRISITVGVIAVGIYVTIGIVLGALAGYFGRWVDILISRFIEVMISFPLLFFVLTIVAMFETRSIFLIMAAIGLTGWTGVARLVRGEFLTQRNLDYATAAEALGIPKRRVIFGHILPNAVSPVLVSATFGVAAAILVESSIAFLGLGDPTAASWGLLLNQGRQTNLDWLILAPGAAIFFTVTVFNLLGEGLRDALDPKLRQ